MRFAQGKPLELIDGTRHRELCAELGVTELSVSVGSASDQFKADPSFVRLVSVVCSDPHENGELQAHVFTSGTLSIATGLAYSYPTGDILGPCGFSFSHIYVNEVAHTTSASSCLEISFRTHATELPTYRMVFEGRSEVVEPLHQAALSRMGPRSHSGDMVQRSGCMLLLLLPITVVVLWRLL